MKYTYDEFVQKLVEKYHEPFKILKYNGTSKAGEYYCGYCHKTYQLARMGNLLKENRKHICTHCFASKLAEEALIKIETIDNLHFNKFGYNEKLHKPTIIYQCLNCQEQTEKPLVEFLKYPTCTHCGYNAKRRNDNSIQLFIPPEFELLTEYKGQYEKSLFRHLKCGFIFRTRPKDIINGHTYCPKCSKKYSKGEKKIIDFLEFHNIIFEKEKVFNWSDKKRYDFYLPVYNLLIEYNGIQHYKEIPNFFLPLEEQQAIDNFKITAAKEQGFNILVISYKDFDNIEAILAQRLKENT